jgi:hypothetical protein
MRCGPRSPRRTSTISSWARAQPEARLEIVREIFLASDKTTVHLKDFASGPDGFLPFVRSVLAGLAAYQF